MHPPPFTAPGDDREKVLAAECPGGDVVHHKAIFRGGVPTTYAIEKAGTAPCRHACPIDQRAQGYVALIRAGDFAAAYRTIKRENPFPSVCGRVCNHRCEETCTRCEIDEPVAVMALKRFVADWAAEIDLEAKVEIPPSSGYRVAIVGSGPAGLTAARELNRLGHTVTILEALPVAGGMMRVGIPAFRLPRVRLLWEIDEILSEGVELRTNSRVENVACLFVAGFDAVVLACGMHVSRGLSIPGAEEIAPVGRMRDGSDPDVWGAIEFLRRVNLGDRPNWTGRRVVVVGGGSTAMDTARVCRRLGAKVQVIYRRSRAEMPAHDVEVDDAQREGVTIRFLSNPEQVLRKGGRVVAVRCVGMELGSPDESGRRRPIPIEGSQFTLPADTVLLAVGQISDLSLLSESQAVWNGSGAVQRDPATLMRGQPGLFVAGDLAGTDGFVVDAIASGSQVARSVDRYLRGPQGIAEPITQPEVALGEQQVAQLLIEAAPRGTARTRMRSILPDTLLGDFAETGMGLSEVDAMAEAARCLGCGLCSECLACVEVCPAGAIDHEAQARTLEVEAGAIILADAGSEPGIRDFGYGGSGVYLVGNGRSLSSAMDQALFRLGLVRPTPSVSVAAPSRWQLAPDGGKGQGETHNTDLGVFFCRCGGEITRVVDFPAVMARVAGLPGVAYVTELDFACHPEGSAAVRAAMADNDLCGGVLAACSCCALDQICYSCTTQRTRCKEHLGVWDDLSLPFEFVNVREHCAFVHGEDPGAATRKAGDMVAASVTAMRVAGSRAQMEQRVHNSHPQSPVPITAEVDPVRCRGCDDCERVCGLQAIRVVADNGARTAQVDATRCLGCGVCLAVCSSGAIFAGDRSDRQAEAMLVAMGDLSDTTVVFSCNWGAYSAVEAAGVGRLPYDASVRLVRVMCSGRVHEGLILRAFSRGAARVLVLACGYEENESLCHYHTGNGQAGRCVEQAQQLLNLLGIDPARLALVEMRPGDGARFVAAVDGFLGTPFAGVRGPAAIVEGQP
jgi:NADPH-dependent glutamate synthase beta subunit-like oxidoreductase/coenzyme F420-reducing hydrogenase delta subunit/Pyruvate/2-oxoacid:ferredoxin oxidoreductase delta subunit